MIVKIGDRWGNMANVTYIEDEGSHVTVYFAGPLAMAVQDGGPDYCAFEGEEADALLRYLETFPDLLTVRYAADPSGKIGMVR